MGTFSITTYNKQLVILYNSEEGDEIQLSSITFFNPSVEVKGNKFSFFESGTYKKSISFKEIYLINDVEPTDSEDAFNKIIEGIANFNRGGAAPYKVYTALLTQNGGDDPLGDNGGTAAGNYPELVIGRTYYIVDNFQLECDFTNVGAPNNNVGTYFVATGTTPASWGTYGELRYNTGAPVVTVLENTIGDIWWTYDGVGRYKANLLGVFTNNKCVGFTNIWYSDGNDNYLTYDFNMYTPDGFQISTMRIDIPNDPSDNKLLNTPIEIRVYN